MKNDYCQFKEICLHIDKEKLRKLQEGRANEIDEISQYQEKICKSKERNCYKIQEN